MLNTTPFGKSLLCVLLLFQNAAQCLDSLAQYQRKGLYYHPKQGFVVNLAKIYYRSSTRVWGGEPFLLREGGAASLEAV